MSDERTCVRFLACSAAGQLYSTQRREKNDKTTYLWAVVTAAASGRRVYVCLSLRAVGVGAS